MVKSEMVREILLQNQNPEKAIMEIYTPRWTPLHRAAAKGNLDIVRNLLSVNADMCFYYDIYGRTPLHVASIRGKVDVLKEMARVRPEAALETMENGDTILHLCARSNNWEALKGVMEVFGDGDLFNSKNDDGNTILHIAAIQKQNEIVEFLVHNTSVDVNIRNHKGLTTLDILSAEKETPNDDYAFAGGEIPHLSTSDAKSMTSPTTLKKKKNGRSEDNNWVRKKRNPLMVVASLLATMAFQGGVTPPGGFWQDSGVIKSGGINVTYDAGNSVFANLHPDEYKFYISVNTAGFISSLSIILLLVSGLPIRHPLFMWILMIIMWTAISTMTLAYLLAVDSVTSGSNIVYEILDGAVYFWMGLIALLMIAHTIRLLFRAIKRMGKTITKRMRKRKQSADNINI